MKVRIETATRRQKENAKDYAMKWLKEVAMPIVTRNVEAIILYQMHEQFGFGKKRLQQFFDNTAPMIKDMLNEYNWDKDEDAIWLCEYKLKKEVGIDLAELRSPFRSDVEVK